MFGNIAEYSGDYWQMVKTHGIVRVFPRKTSFTPTDPYAFVGMPPLSEFRPPNPKDVHISVSFTWDIKRGYELQEAWGQYYPFPKIGGPAMSSEVHNGHFQSMYVKPNVIFTSTGCNNDCPWCLVSLREGKLKENTYYGLGAVKGNEPIYVQDNNFLQCSRLHIDKVVKMLQFYRAVTFSGGLDARLIDDYAVDRLRTLRIRQVFLSCDTRNAINSLRQAISKLKLLRQRVRCYVLLRFDATETISDATERLIEVWEAGAMPFAQLYQPTDRYIQYSKEWRDLARAWSRPAITKSLMEKIGK